MGGYNREDSAAFKFFKLNNTKSNEEDTCNSKYKFDFELLRDEVNEEDDVEEMYESDDIDEEEEEAEEEEGDDCENREDEVSDEDLNKTENELVNTTSKEELELESGIPFEPPDWILQKILIADLPRFIIDLLHLKLYVNSPQIENFMLNDSNEIALPILQLIFTLIHYSDACQFQYLTRVHRISNVHYKKIESISLDNQFDPMVPQNVQFFRKIFDNLETKINAIACLPEHMRLFVLAMVYLSDKNSTVAPAFYHSLIIGLLLLSKADDDVQPVSRDPRVLQKKYGQLLDSVASKQKSKEHMETDEESNQIDPVNMGHSITTNDSVFFLRNVLPLFQISDKIREKHTDFSSTIVHTFAEFQAIIFNLNCLNTLLNKPFQHVVVSKAFNGTFLYNMYVNLRDRPNIEYYVQHHVFKDCKEYFHFYANILNVCKSMILCLTDSGDKLKKAKASRNYRRNRRKQKLKMGDNQGKHLVHEAFMDVESEDLNNDELEFNDANNKFATLLNSSKVL